MEPPPSEHRASNSFNDIQSFVFYIYYLLVRYYRSTSHSFDEKKNYDFFRYRESIYRRRSEQTRQLRDSSTRKGEKVIGRKWFSSISLRTADCRLPTADCRLPTADVGRGRTSLPKVPPSRYYYYTLWFIFLHPRLHCPW